MDYSPCLLVLRLYSKRGSKNRGLAEEASNDQDSRAQLRMIDDGLGRNSVKTMRIQSVIVSAETSWDSYDFLFHLPM
jgi:hypothetical protein